MCSLLEIAVFRLSLLFFVIDCQVTMILLLLLGTAMAQTVTLYECVLDCGWAVVISVRENDDLTFLLLVESNRHGGRGGRSCTVGPGSAFFIVPGSSFCVCAFLCLCVF